MNKTLLIDLDDTLLGNHMDDFLPSYLNALSKHLSPFVPPEKMVPQLLAATRLMEENNQPDCTLEKVFSAAFYPALGLRKQDLTEVLAEFYDEIFPNLNYMSVFRPEAVQVVETALSAGYQIAIATNPLFPLAAVKHRLAWAGLPIERYPFKIVGSYEPFHFAKPNPAYFAEILAHMGWPEGSIVMVGDDPRRDIVPASQLGLATFQVNATKPIIQDQQAHGSGTLQDLIPWLESTPPEHLRPDYKTPQAALATLRSTPAVLDTWCDQLPAQRWSMQSRPPAWCPVEILCHLRDGDIEVNLPRLRKILSSYNPFIPGMDTDRWAEERKYILQNGWQSLKDFTAARLEMLAILESLTPDDWQRPARHAIFGPSRLFEMVEITSAHDRLHMQQLREELTSISV